MKEEAEHLLGEILGRKKPTPQPPPSTQIGPNIVLLNESTKLTAVELSHIAVALQLQVSRDFGPLWATDAHIYTDHSPAGSWPFHLVDYPGPQDPSGALGYHDLGADGLPYARVFVGTSLDHGITPSSVISHELCECLADPFVDCTVFVQDSASTGVLFMLEACDAPEAESYEIGGGVQVSNFVNRRWFIPGSHGPWDFLGHIMGPLRLLHGGYIGALRVTASSGWGSQTASLPAADWVPSDKRALNPRHIQWLPGAEESS